MTLDELVDEIEDVYRVELDNFCEPRARVAMREEIKSLIAENTTMKETNADIMERNGLLDDHIPIS